MCIIFVVRERK